MKRQDITASKAGRRTLISFAELKDFLASLPRIRQDMSKAKYRQLTNRKKLDRGVKSIMP
ncbi:hypothetical protein NB311A_00240 [Nitrobacter sp. Nb-311A]|nr:hypothetical protein NB311A_00240 [Nitrobacter sp. Nb-311A]